MTYRQVVEFVNRRSKLFLFVSSAAGGSMLMAASFAHFVRTICVGILSATFHTLYL